VHLLQQLIGEQILPQNLKTITEIQPNQSAQLDTFFYALHAPFEAQDSLAAFHMRIAMLGNGSKSEFLFCQRISEILLPPTINVLGNMAQFPSNCSD
jgi:hypothetical protein